jgi:hypothetical protein
VEIGPSLEQVRGEGVAERMDAAPLRDSRPLFGGRVELLRGGDVHGPRPIPGREQPLGGPVLPPVGPEFLQQPGRQEGVAILAPLALLNAEAHPLGVEVAELEPDHLPDPQTGGVGGSEDRPLLAIARGLQHAPDLRGTEDLGEPLRLLGRRDRERGHGPRPRVVW